MVARRRQKDIAAVASTGTGESNHAGDGALQKAPEKEKKKQDLNAQITSQKVNALRNAHMAPILLVISVMICSGAMWVLAFRDVFATGRPVIGSMDNAMQHFTKSAEFYDSSGGWKSTQGGLSTIMSVTTDENNMGGLFVRKAAGAAALAVHSQKLIPLLFQPAAAHWASGHFFPLLITSALGNLSIATFYSLYAEELNGAGAGPMSRLICTLLIVEAIILLGYAITVWRGRKAYRRIAKLPAGKSPLSVPSRIVARTIAIVSSAVAFIAVRDLAFPGQIISIIPRDDVYLEWTNAYFHSPPPGSEEAEENGLEAPLYVGDKFVSQLLALHLLVSCFHKLASAFFIRIGKDGSGEVKGMLFWRSQALGDGMLLFIMRLFTPAAKSASLDLRWHLMTLGYETFILALYGFV